MKAFKIAATFSILFFLTTTCKAQVEINAQEAAQHIGDSVQVCDIVLEGKYLYEAKDEPAQLFMGSRLPDPLLTIVIPKNVRMGFNYDPEKKLVNKHVCVTGRVSTFEGRPAIIVRDENSIRDLDD